MTNISDLEVEILQLINQHRQNLNLAPLAFHTPIQAASYQHSQNMADGRIPFGHEGFSERANQLIELLNGTAASENVALGQRSAQEVVNSWLNSDGHRKNIEGDYNLTGISVVPNTQNENVFTQLFIKAPTPSSSLSDNPPAVSNSSSSNTANHAETNLNYSILKLINKHRAGQYLSPLQINPHVQVMATQHAQDMASGNIPFSHEGFQERARLLIEKVGGSSVAENVAVGQGDSGLIVNSWLDSDGHRKNIEGDFNITGIGVAQAEDGRMFYCQIFLKR